MPHDQQYDIALSTALAVLHRLESTPGMSRPEKLSIATYLILEALKKPPPEAIAESEGSHCPQCLQPFTTISLAGRTFHSRACGCAGEATRN